MKENGRMNWLAQIRQMKNRDIRTIEQSELQELQQDAVEHGLPQEERLKNLLDKVRNPYCYLDNIIMIYEQSYSCTMRLLFFLLCDWL